MDIAHKLAHLNADSALAAWFIEQLQKARNTVKTKEQEIQNKECKIKALTPELAYYKLLKFSAKT